MAHVRSVILCDFAQVREGLLFVSSGGITRIAAPTLGSAVQFYVAGEIEVMAHEADLVHNVDVKVNVVDTSTTIWHSHLQIQTNRTNEGMFPGESLHIPFACPVGPMPVSAFGPHDLKVSLDDSETEITTFYLLQITPTPPIA
ncbi:MAG: hypothetical protein R2698_08055 [Microthrixaceae bacterium]